MIGFLDRLLKPLQKDRAWLAEVSGINEATLSRINNGKGSKYRTLGQIAPHLNISASDMTKRLEEYRKRCV